MNDTTYTVESVDEVTKLTSWEKAKSQDKQQPEDGEIFSSGVLVPTMESELPQDFLIQDEDDQHAIEEACERSQPLRARHKIPVDPWLLKFSSKKLSAEQISERKVKAKAKAKSRQLKLENFQEFSATALKSYSRAQLVQMIVSTAGKSKAKLSAEEKERQNKKISFENVLAQNQSGNLRSVQKNALKSKFKSKGFQAKLKEKIKSQSSADKKEDSEKQGSEK